MRNRSNSGVRLDYYQRIVHRIILRHQNPITGLYPRCAHNHHAWIRDNVYCCISVWALSMCYKKIADQDEDRSKTYELEQSCVKLMRGLLMAMMKQKEKVERFKMTQNPLDSLHAKYSSETGDRVVADHEWGHLQIDAVSLYLLMLAQMTASGLQIVFNMDEVAFVQNLVFYIESAYFTPDYGIWERGDKTNHGLPELNASSIGMAKAALEALNDLDLFGARGGPYSVIHVLADEAQKCQAVLNSILPRESNSKEADSGILSVLGFPAFALDDKAVITHTRDNIISKLKGAYGCKRFLRDGYKTPKEDLNRLYYNPAELKMFEHIECEWPLFYCYLIIDYIFRGDEARAREYTELLENIMIRDDEGMKLVPQLYAVPNESVDAELKEPGSQSRIAIGQNPFLWGQSLYVLGKLLQEGFLAIGELDPLNRRLCSEKKPDVVVQVVILAEDNNIREKLMEYDIVVQTIDEVAPIEVQPARVLSHFYTYLGRNNKLNLTGRKSRDVGILSTSKLYSLGDRIFAFTPQNFDAYKYYTNHDSALLADKFRTNVAFLTMNWKHMLGRPTLVVIASKHYLDEGRIPIAMITTMKKLRSGYINGTRVILGNLSDFLTTSCLTSLSFLGCQESGMPNELHPDVQKYLHDHVRKNSSTKSNLLNVSSKNRNNRHLKRKMSVKGAIKKTRSINIDILGSDSTECTPEKDTPQTSNTLSLDVVDSKSRPRSGSISTRNRTTSELHYSETEAQDLFAMLRETDSLEEQGDILQYLVRVHGLDHNSGMLEHGRVVTLRDLLKGLYEKACAQKLWGLVRHTAGVLGKRVEDLAKSVTDLLVHQKQVTVGMPPNNEHTITAPLPENDIRQLINTAYGEDDSTAMLTQEILLYLGMFIRTEPQLFLEMLRLRIGLIIQVMAMELSRASKDICDAEEASDRLFSLSPFEMKNLLHHIMSGKEFSINSVRRGYFSIVSSKTSHISKKSQFDFNTDIEADDILDKQGQWLRRRRLDGALNRVPTNFYERVWSILEKYCAIDIAGKVLKRNLTQEMTSGELKFALEVETVLNSIPQPEYRQLIVETLMVLTLICDHNVEADLGEVVQVDKLVRKANELFLEDQIIIKGDATLCCVNGITSVPDDINITSLKCNGAALVCQHFYDSAPSGAWGTMTYITRAVASICFPSNGDMECTVS